MILNRTDALYAANVFVDYFSNFGRIDDYLRKVKLERMSNYPVSLPGMGPEDDMFNNFDIHPNDMEFECKEVSNEMFVNYLEIVTSHAVEVSVPGKSIKWVVYEKNTGQIAGFIRLGSPTINSKPRNNFLGKPLNTLDPATMKRFNDSAIMGFIIVPTQPFGFNYLGGKLLALMCCSHEVKQIIDEKYDMNLCHFETTSLYGSTKSMSQYDGLKPFMKGQGLTDSNFAPLMNDNYFKDLEKFFVEKNGGPIVWEGASSRKMKVQSKMISIIKKSLNGDDKKTFTEVVDDARRLNERKRFYVSDLGYENSKDVILGKTDTLIKKSNHDRYSINNLTEWWRKKASNRYNTLCSDGRLRDTLEVWNENPDDIDIIR